MVILEMDNNVKYHEDHNIKANIYTEGLYENNNTGNRFI